MTQNPNRPTERDWKAVDEVMLVCALASAAFIAGSVMRSCVSCAARVTLSPDGQQMERRGIRLNILCPSCALVVAGDRPIDTYPGQDDDLARAVGPAAAEHLRAIVGMPLSECFSARGFL